MPLGRKGQISAVLLFYSSHAIPYSRNLEQTIIFLANDILSEVCSKKGSHTCSDLQFFTQGEHPVAKKSQSVISKVWESAKAALGIPPEQRTEANVSDIIKFSKRLPFFKYVTNTSREVLCKGMQIIQLDDGEVVVRSQERQEYVWYIVIKGSADLVLCAEPGAQAYVVHAFQEGDTFAHPYIDLYSSGLAGIEGCIRSSEPNTSCVRVFVPDGCREDFRAQTKPLWYKVRTPARRVPVWPLKWADCDLGNRSWPCTSTSRSTRPRRSWACACEAFSPNSAAAPRLTRAAAAGRPSRRCAGGTASSAGRTGSCWGRTRRWRCWPARWRRRRRTRWRGRRGRRRR